MSLRPFRNIDRKKTKVINVGDVKVGGDNPISVLVSVKHVKRAIAALHKEFKLD